MVHIRLIASTHYRGEKCNESKPRFEHFRKQLGKKKGFEFSRPKDAIIFYSKLATVHLKHMYSQTATESASNLSQFLTTRPDRRRAYLVRMTLASVTSPFRENTSRSRFSSARLGRFFTHSRDDLRSINHDKIKHQAATKAARRGTAVRRAALLARRGGRALTWLPPARLR